MKSAQARASVETLREVQNDKALKTKAEKERRLRHTTFQSHFFICLFLKEDSHEIKTWTHWCC